MFDSIALSATEVEIPSAGAMPLAHFCFPALLSGPPPFYYLSRGLGTPIPGNDSAQTTSFEYCSLLYALWKRVDAEWRGDVAWRKEPDSAA